MSGGDLYLNDLDVSYQTSRMLLGGHINSAVVRYASIWALVRGMGKDVPLQYVNMSNADLHVRLPSFVNNDGTTNTGDKDAQPAIVLHGLLTENDNTDTVTKDDQTVDYFHSLPNLVIDQLLLTSINVALHDSNWAPEAKSSVGLSLPVRISSLKATPFRLHNLVTDVLSSLVSGSISGAPLVIHGASPSDNVDGVIQIDSLPIGPIVRMFVPQSWLSWLTGDFSFAIDTSLTESKELLLSTPSLPQYDINLRFGIRLRDVKANIPSNLPLMQVGWVLHSQL
jgi:hypothetical protein